MATATALSATPHLVPTRILDQAGAKLLLAITLLALLALGQAGTAITTALYSLFLNKPIRHDVAITGEINLSGRVTAIGGLDLKILGGIRAGVKRFLFPKENQLAFDKFMEKHNEDSIIEGIEFYPVEEIEEVFKLVF